MKRFITTLVTKFRYIAAPYLRLRLTTTLLTRLRYKTVPYNRATGRHDNLFDFTFGETFN